MPFPRLPLHKPRRHTCRCRRGGPDPDAFKAENVRSGLAYFVVVWSLAVLLVSVAAFGVDDAMRLSAFFSGLVGVVLGFYFGKQGAELAVQTADQAVQQTEATKKLAAGAGKATEAKLDENEKAVQDLTAKLEETGAKHKELSDDYQQLLDAVLADAAVAKKVKRSLEEKGA